MKLREAVHLSEKLYSWLDERNDVNSCEFNVTYDACPWFGLIIPEKLLMKNRRCRLSDHFAIEVFE